MKSLALLVAIDYNEIENPDRSVRDTTSYTFVANASYQGGVLIDFTGATQIDRAMSIIGQARQLLL